MGMLGLVSIERDEGGSAPGKARSFIFILTGGVDMATVKGYVEKIKFRNEDNGYSVLSLGYEGQDYVLVGTFPYISEGDLVEAKEIGRAHV